MRRGKKGSIPAAALGNDRSEQVFRNAGFVISTVLLRVSPSTPKPYDVALALLAMLYGLAVLGVFACFAAIERKRDAVAAAGRQGRKDR